MARIRSVKPEFWTDPDIVSMPMATRLFFIGCWNHADDFGVLRDDPDRLRLQIMPADPVDAHEMVDELVKRRHLLRMTAPDGTALLVVRTFCVHQKIDKRAAGRWGKPDEFVPANPSATPASPADPTPIPTNPPDSPPTPPLELVTEGTSKDIRESVSGEPTTMTRPGSSADADAAFAEFWKKYPRKVDKARGRAAYAKALRGKGAPTPEGLLAALAAQIDVWARAGQPVDKQPHATTWLNARRWEDDELAKPPRDVSTPAETYDRAPQERYR